MRDSRLLIRLYFVYYIYNVLYLLTIYFNDIEINNKIYRVKIRLLSLFLLNL